jgi:hypothetical protein
MTIRPLVAMVFVLGSSLLGMACGSSTPTAASAVSSMSINGAAPGVGATSQFTATATLSDGTTEDVTSLATWSSSDPGAASVSAGGVVTGVGSGTAVVTATYSMITASLQVTVS